MLLILLTSLVNQRLELINELDASDPVIKLNPI